MHRKCRKMGGWSTVKLKHKLVRMQNVLQEGVKNQCVSFLSQRSRTDRVQEKLSGNFQVRRMKWHSLLALCALFFFWAWPLSLVTVNLVFIHAVRTHSSVLLVANQYTVIFVCCSLLIHSPGGFWVISTLQCLQM